MSGESYESHSNTPLVQIAEECLNIFMLEINGIGIAHGFDHGPRTFDAVINYTIPSHLKNPERLQESIVNFNKYKETLKEWSPFPITEVLADYSSENAPDREVTREISPELLDIYDKFGRALENYSRVIDDRIEGIADDDEVRGAAIELCKIARPNMWNPDVEQSSPVYNSMPLRDTKPRWYLEAVILEAGQ